MTASRLDNATSSEGKPYQAFADVTSKVTAGGDGVYKLADIQSTDGKNRWAGWALVIAYEDASQPTRNLTVYDGFGVVQRSPEAEKNLTISVSGIRDPESRHRQHPARPGLYEGDSDYYEDVSP